jgi:hypothetical protein
MTEPGYNGSMPRAKKDEAAKHVAHQVVFTPAVWSDLSRLVPMGKRSAFVDAAVNQALDALRIKELQQKVGGDEP